MWLFQLVLGLYLAFNGRRAVWALAGIAGFLVGLWLATTIWDQDPTVITLFEGIVAVLAGLIGAALAQAFGRLAIAAAGFVAGGYGLLTLVSAGLITTDSTWPLFMIGGVIGIILVGVVFDLAVIGLTAWIGAGLVLSALDLSGFAAWAVFGLVFVFGGLAQLRGDRPSKTGVQRNKNETDE